MKKQTFIKPGDKLNRLTAVEFEYIGPHHRRHFKFRCDCGREKIISAEAVISGNTKSCGCLSRETKAAKALPGHIGAMRQVILQDYKRAGKRRKWMLTEDEFYHISQKNCFYCSIPPTNIRHGVSTSHDFIYNGLDRIDSSKEYTLDNVVACCKKCNIAKNDMSLSEFHDWVKRISAMAEQWGLL